MKGTSAGLFELHLLAHPSSMPCLRLLLHSWHSACPDVCLPSAPCPLLPVRCLTGEGLQLGRKVFIKRVVALAGDLVEVSCALFAASCQYGWQHTAHLPCSASPALSLRG